MSFLLLVVIALFSGLPVANSTEDALGAAEEVGFQVLKHSDIALEPGLPWLVKRFPVHVPPLLFSGAAFCESFLLPTWRVSFFVLHIACAFLFHTLRVCHCNSLA